MSKPIMTISFPTYLRREDYEGVMDSLPQEIKDKYTVVVLQGAATLEVENTRLRIAAQFVSSLMQPNDPAEATPLIIDLALSMADNLMLKESQTR